MAESTELKPCPFGCKRGLTVYQSLDCEYVVCDHCESTGPAAKTREEAIAAWNRRPAVDAADAEQLEREAFDAWYKPSHSMTDDVAMAAAFSAGWQAAQRSVLAAPEGWRTLVEDLVEELEEQVLHRYQGYPPDDRRFVRDMLTVKEAREFLEAHKDKP